jgi:hypothetical protein
MERLPLENVLCIFVGEVKGRVLTSAPVIPDTTATIASRSKCSAVRVVLAVRGTDCSCPASSETSWYLPKELFLVPSEKL